MLNLRYQSGFNLIELMLTIAILGIVMAFALPAFSDFFDKRRLIAGAEAIYGELQYARSEAVARSQNIIVSVDRDGNTDWELGMVAGAGACDPDITSPTTANACFLEIDDGDGVSTPANDYVLKRIEDADYEGVNMVSSTYLYDSSANLTFNFIRGTANSGEIQLQSDNAAAGGRGSEIRVLVNTLGRISMCSPASGNNKVGGYPDC